ncbi:MAG: inorganic phosphate transporter [Candidatus Dormibacteraeota bacterium]|nr:inorganic phosphate transporter [Candidatus Dormibacteraeota bacterium]MBO0761822.1 inorganic phosphate transporter [Candidatus Dormibacteraeota bacterium]
MSQSAFVVLLVVVAALSFDFTNGFHDTANAMATSIATGALPPRVAVGLSAVLNVVGAFISIAVATTIAKGIVDSHAITVGTVFAGLVGAIVWNLVTWYLGLPSSSSHALIGGLVGASLVTAGTGAVEFGGILSKVILPAVISPVVAGLAALLATSLAFRITARSPREATARGYKLGQIGSAAMVSLAHGTNDAQKTMGVITLALISGGLLGDNAGVPVWVILACAVVIGAGTYLGGWRVIRTLGKGLTEITTPQGFAAESCSSAVILVSSHFGFPLSTTQVCSGSIMGAGAARRLSDVRWSVAGRMVLAWLVTLPGSAAIAGFANLVARGVGGLPGTILIALACAAFSAGIWLLSRRNAINPDNVNAPIPEGARSPLAVQEA